MNKIYAIRHFVVMNDAIGFELGDATIRVPFERSGSRVLPTAQPEHGWSRSCNSHNTKGGNRMVATAIVQNGGMFIPDVGKLFGVNHSQVTVNITIINTRVEDDPFEKAVGILRGQLIDPLTFEREMRTDFRMTGLSILDPFEE